MPRQPLDPAAIARFAGDTRIPDSLSLRPGMFAGRRASPAVLGPAYNLPPDAMAPAPGLEFSDDRMPSGAFSIGAGAPHAASPMQLISASGPLPMTTPLRTRPQRPDAKPAHGRRPPDEVVAAAQRMQRRWGIPASVSIAQWAIESGWGERTPKDSNNPFGIKALKGQPTVTASTREYDKEGKAKIVQQPFRKFSSLDEAWEGRSKMLATSRLYAAAQPHLRDPEAFVDAIAPVYAPGNSLYATTIKQIMRSNRLYSYDEMPPAPDLAAPR